MEVPFKLYGHYSNSIHFQMWPNSPGIDLLTPHSSLEREGKIGRPVFTSSIKRRIRKIHVVVVTAKKWTKWHGAHVKKPSRLFQKIYCCFNVLVANPAAYLKLPIKRGLCRRSWRQCCYTCWRDRGHSFEWLIVQKTYQVKTKWTGNLQIEPRHDLLTAFIG